MSLKKDFDAWVTKVSQCSTPHLPLGSSWFVVTDGQLAELRAMVKANSAKARRKRAGAAKKAIANG
jgi:hypothetical protein